MSAAVSTQIVLVESKVQNIGLLVLLFLFQALLKLALLLKAVLLGHLALLLFGLHHATFRAEVLQFTVKHLVLTELALQTAVVKGNLDAGLQTNLVEALLAVAQYPGVVALELVLQSLTNHLVGTQQVGCRDTLTIRWVRYHDALVGRLCKVLEVLLLYGDDIAQSGCLHIHAGGVHSLHVDVVAVNLVVKLTLLTLVVVDLIKQVGIKVRPLLKGKLLAEQSWCHVLGYQGSLNQQGTATTHGVDKISIGLPSAQQNHTSCQHLVQWCLYTLLAVATTMQTLTARVETQRTFVFSNVHVQSDVRVGHRYIGALARLLAELVNNRILYFIRNKL